MITSELHRFQMHGQDLPWLLAHQATYRADHPALVWDPSDGMPRQWTYAELYHDVKRLATGLRARGIGFGDKLLIHADNCPEGILTWLACAAIGATSVTTNTSSTAIELEWLVQKAQCAAAVTQSRFAPLVTGVSSKMKWVAVIADADLAPILEQNVGSELCRFDSLYGDEAEWLDRPIDPMLPIGIMFTSGTTSKPKAVVHTHANAIWASRIGPRNIDLAPDDRYLIYTPFFHASAQTWALCSTLGVGATAVLVPRWSSSRFWDVVQRHGVTHISIMPFCISTLMAPDRPHTALRVGVFGLLMPEGRRIFGLDVYAAYGMTETVTHAISAKPAENLPARSMGRITAGYELAIVDKEAGSLCTEGETGELWLRGARGVQIFLEYFDDPDANAAAFEDGWFKTGDMVKMGSGGSVVYVERDKDLLKVGGENVSAREVEDVIGTVTGVARVAVVGKRHAFLDQVVVAFITRSPGAANDAALVDSVIQTCCENLAKFKVPKAVYIVDEIPAGELGKVIKARLREMADEMP